MTRTSQRPARFGWPVYAFACALAWGCDDSGGSGSPDDAGDTVDGPSVDSSDGGNTPDVEDTDSSRPPDAAADGEAVPPDAAMEPPDATDPDAAQTPDVPDAQAPDAGPPPPPLLINEVSCRGDEWVEVVNPTAEEVSLSRWVLTDRADDDGRGFEIPPGTTVPAGGFVVVPGEGELPFGIGCDGETLTLLDPRGREVDRMTVEMHEETATWGRLPDGADAWQATHPTPGGPNQAIVEIDVWLNEVECRAPEWIELVSGEDEAVDLSGWILTDRPGEPDRGYAVPDGVVLEARGFLVLPPDGDELPFGVGCDGETISLLDDAGRPIDDVVIEAPGRGTTWGRLPDGEGAWGPTSATRGAPNEPFRDRGVRLNEIQCRGDEWVELHNMGAEAVALGGWAVADELADVAQRMVLPDELVIEPGGFALVAPEGGLPFGIGCVGDTVWLVDAGGAPVDSASPDDPPEGAGWGRLPDGDGEWSSTLPTPGAANRPLIEVAVALNEVQCRGEEWVELYNFGGEAVDLSGWFVSDLPEDQARRHVVPDGTSIGAGDWLVLPADGELPFRIGCDGDAVVLVHERGQLVDRVVLAEPREGATMGRLPDGRGEWVETAATRGRANDALLVPSVSFNEVQCRGEMEWLELVNTGEAPVDLTGWAVADAVDDPAVRLRIANGMLAPGDYFVVDLPLDAPFGIGCGGDDIHLVSPQGVVVDVVVVDSPGPLSTWGRFPDTVGPWMSTFPTRGAPNELPPMMP